MAAGGVNLNLATTTPTLDTKNWQAFSPAGDTLRDWMNEYALPLWAKWSWDDRRGGFRECLGFDGNPCTEPFRRLFVQARQIYVFSAAHLLGWDRSAIALANNGFDYLTSHGWLMSGGWAHKLDGDGLVIDKTRDTYDHAFILFAMAWYYRATGENDAIVWAERTLSYLDSSLIDPVHGGYQENLNHDLPRRANPHMHLLEALLALYDATSDIAYLDRANRLANLMKRAFFDQSTGSIGEFFHKDWSASRANAGHHREPGHQFEWAFLLDSLEVRSGEDFSKEIRALVSFTNQYGINTATGLVHDVVDAVGRPIITSHHLWCQSEAIRARLMLASRGFDNQIQKAVELTNAVFHHHLTPVMEGLWHGMVGHDGVPIDAAVPASTLYHLMTLHWDIETRARLADKKA